MASSAYDTGMVDTTLASIPVLAVNVLDRLGYSVSRASKQLHQVLATERLDERIGRDWWHHEYKVVLRWRDAITGGVLVEVDITEKKGGGTNSDCQRRCDEILLQLQADAERASCIDVSTKKSTIHGAAQWGSEQDLRAAGYLLKKPDPKRLIIGKTATNDYIQVPELLTYAHALVCGRTGVGKSRGFFIPQLIERTGTSMLVTEATPGYEPGELYKLTSGWRKLAGHQVYSFNPSDMASHRINPIDKIRYASPELKSQIAERLADVVILNGEVAEGKGDQTWNRSEKILLIPLLMHAAASEPEQGHFGALRWLLLQGPDRLAKVLSNSPSEIAQMEFEGWLRLAGETNFKYGVFSGLITKLNPWMTDQMVALTETTDVDLEALKRELFTFYLAVPSRSKDSKLIGAIMVNFLMDHILTIREEMKYPVAMLLDEFTNFGKISGIGAALSLIRKNKIGLVLGFQNYFQLEQVYNRNEAQVIMDMPATQVYFKQKNYREAKELSDALGRMTVEETAVTDSGRVQEIIQGRALATPDELINLNNEVIVFTPSTSPLKLPVTSPTAYEAALAYPAPERRMHNISEYIRRRGSVRPTDEQHPREHPNDTKTTPNNEEKRRKRDKRQRNRDNRSRDFNANRNNEYQKPEQDDLWQAE